MSSERSFALAFALGASACAAPTQSTGVVQFSNKTEESSGSCIVTVENTSATHVIEVVRNYNESFMLDPGEATELELASNQSHVLQHVVDDAVQTEVRLTECVAGATPTVRF